MISLPKGIMATEVMFRALSFFLLFIGTCCQNDPCNPIVRGESFTRFMDSMSCVVDAKLFNLFDKEETFNKSILSHPYSNFMCIGLIDVLALAPENLCDLSDPLEAISGNDFCSSSKMVTTLHAVIDGSVFDDNPNIVKVSNFTERNCKVVCEGDANQLCWAFGTIARAVLKHIRRSTAVPTTNPISAAPTTKPEIPVLNLASPGNGGESNGDTNSDTNGDSNDDTNGDSNDDTNGDSNDDTNGDSNDDTNGDSSDDSNGKKGDQADVKVGDEDKPTLHNVTKFFDEKQQGSNSVGEAEANEGNKDEDSTNTGPLDKEVQKNTTNQDGQSPSKAAPNDLQDNLTDYNNDTDIHPPSGSKVADDDQTVTNGTDDASVQPEVTNVAPTPLYTEDDTNKDNDQGGDNPSAGDDGGDMDHYPAEDGVDQHLDSSEPTPNQSSDFDDDDDDDGYSYWHFAAVLLFILFLGVAGYLASLNRKKVSITVVLLYGMLLLQILVQ